MRSIDSHKRAESRELRAEKRQQFSDSLLSGLTSHLLALLLIGFYLPFFCLALICPSYAVSKDTSTQATVKVSSVFELKIADSAVSDFGNATAGQWIEIPASGNYANSVVCKSNTANPWHLKIKASGPLSNSTYSIPTSNFKWMSTYAGSKNAPYQSLVDGLKHKPAESYQAFSLIDETVYSSGASDNSNLPEGTEIQFKYALLIPDNQKLPTGTYTSAVIYTMTE